MKKMYLSIVLMMIICMFGITAYAAEEPVTLDIEDGAIVITATGYTQGGGEETPYTGSYILTGDTADDQMYNNIVIDGVADGQTITLKDLDITTQGPNAMTINGNVELIATGNISLTNSSPARGFSGNPTITGDADIILKSNNVPGINGNGEINIMGNGLTVSNISMT